MSAPAPQGEPEDLDAGQPSHAGNPPQDSFLLGLQLCRANTMSLTRLQLALRSGNRQCALEAIDRLHALDAKIEHLVRRLPSPANEATDWKAITQHLEDQKIAIAFEKLALASEIRGPDMVSRSNEEYDYEEERRPTSWPLTLSPESEPRWAFNAQLVTWVAIALLAVVALSSVVIVVSAL